MNFFFFFFLGVQYEVLGLFRPYGQIWIKKPGVVGFTKKKFCFIFYFFGFGGFEILKVGWVRVWTLLLCFVRQSKMGGKVRKKYG